VSKLIKNLQERYESNNSLYLYAENHGVKFGADNLKNHLRELIERHQKDFVHRDIVRLYDSLNLINDHELIGYLIAYERETLGKKKRMVPEEILGKKSPEEILGKKSPEEILGKKSSDAFVFYLNSFLYCFYFLSECWSVELIKNVDLMMSFLNLIREQTQKFVVIAQDLRIRLDLNTIIGKYAVGHFEKMVSHSAQGPMINSFCLVLEFCSEVLLDVSADPLIDPMIQSLITHGVGELFESDKIARFVLALEHTLEGNSTKLVMRLNKLIITKLFSLDDSLESIWYLYDLKDLFESIKNTHTLGIIRTIEHLLIKKSLSPTDPKKWIAVVGWNCGTTVSETCVHFYLELFYLDKIKSLVSENSGH
jgi:hypothetical protein